jgi:hypothetical protein
MFLDDAERKQTGALGLLDGGGEIPRGQLIPLDGEL